MSYEKYQAARLAWIEADKTYALARDLASKLKYDRYIRWTEICELSDGLTAQERKRAFEDQFTDGVHIP